MSGASILAWRTASLLACMASLLSSSLSLAGEGYTRQGNALGVEINKELVRRGYCTSPASCNTLLSMYHGHGDKVRFTCFGVSERNRLALGAVAELIVARGIEITSGTPISLVAYNITQEEYRNRGLFGSVKPILTLEIEK